tara:strand:- start:1023 stop:1289 length:267 start_codon:yes stop_codon:yes gene_type:complete
MQHTQARKTKMKKNLKAAKLNGIKFADPDSPNRAYSMGGWGVVDSDGTWLTINKGGLVSAWATKRTAAMIAATIIRDDLTQNQWLTSH